MDAILVKELGGPEVLKLEQKVEIPAIGDDQVLVKMAYAGLNYIDTYHRTGLYPLPLPFTPGREGSGIVEKAGANTNFKPGQKVAFFGAASYAQYAAAPASKTMLLPNTMDLKTAAAVPLQGLTAHYLATSSHPIKAGDIVLIHAAAGGTGGLLVQMAKALGATVIGTAGSAEKVAIAKQLGADFAIDYTKQNFKEEVLKITENKGVHAVYDGVGKATYQDSMDCVRSRGILVLFGNASGAVPAIDPLALTKRGSIFLTRPSLAHHLATREEFDERTKQLMDWIGAGKVKIRIAATLPLKDAKASHELIASRKAAGKILLEIDASL